MTDEESKPPARVNWIGAPQFFNLNHACRLLSEAFHHEPWGHCIYLVGSSLERRDHRDVDIRCMLDDEQFDRLFPGCPRNPQWNARWSFMCAAISEYLSTHSGLPIDFQFQRTSDANRDFHGRPRAAVGIFIDPPTKDVIQSEPTALAE